MKKNFFLLSFIFFFFSINNIFSQVSVDPNNDFYLDAQGWLSKGYIDYLPQLKPYSPAIIEEILLVVKDVEDKADKQRAEDYYNRYFGRKIHLTLSGTGNSRFYNREYGDDNETEYVDDYKIASAKASLGGDIKFNPYFGISYDFGLRGISNDDSPLSVFPYCEKNSEYLKIDDLSFKEGSIDFLLDLNGAISFGNKNIYGSLGFNRVGFGIFPDDDLILNPSSYQLANANINFVSKGFEYTQMFGFPVAQGYNNSDEFKWCKALSFHSIKIPLMQNKFSVSYYESAVYGNYFNPAYLLPAPWALISRVSGFSENVLSGISFQTNILPCFSISTDFMMNDIDLKPFIKLKWNDAAIRGAFKTGIIYTPKYSLFRYIKLDYCIVTPYTYTSCDSSDKKYNFSDYTNYGLCMGTELLPNSHQLGIVIQFAPIKRFSVTTTSKFMQHANQYENLDDKDVLMLPPGAVTDGSLKQITHNLESAKEETGLLNQDSKMTVFRIGIDVDYELRNKHSASISFNAGYSFEYIVNDGVDNPIFPERYETIEQVKMARENWKNNLHKSQNHFFRAGVTIKY